MAPRVLQHNPQLGDLLIKFLRNQQWTHEQSDLARKVKKETVCSVERKKEFLDASRLDGLFSPCVLLSTTNRFLFSPLDSSSHSFTAFSFQVDTLVNPFKQASMGIVKGVTKIGGGIAMISDTVIEGTGKIFRTNTQTPNGTSGNFSKDLQVLALAAETQAEVR